MTLDVYIREQVDELKRDYAELCRRYEEVVHENALLEQRLDWHRRHRDEDYGWMNG